MKFLRFLIVPLFAAALLLLGSHVYSVPAITAAQKERSAHPQKPATFYYICPMHEAVKSKKPGKCPKCKMKLEKKRVKEPTETPDQ